MVGEPLFRVVADAHRHWHQQAGLTTTVLAGPFRPSPCGRGCKSVAARLDGFEAMRYLPDLRIEMARSAVTVSQCGYNTTMDILRARVPAVVVPYSEDGEDEQHQRAQLLSRLGVLRSIPFEGLDAQRLAESVIQAAASSPARVSLDLDGRNTSARIVAELCSALVARVGV